MFSKKRQLRWQQVKSNHKIKLRSARELDPLQSRFLGFSIRWREIGAWMGAAVEKKSCLYSRVNCILFYIFLRWIIVFNIFILMRILNITKCSNALKRCSVGRAPFKIHPVLGRCVFLTKLPSTEQFWVIQGATMIENSLVFFSLERELKNRYE